MKASPIYREVLFLLMKDETHEEGQPYEGGMDFSYIGDLH